MALSDLSAMEYLMIYGLAILIILVVLGILYFLGAFTLGRTGGGAECISIFKYNCQDVVLATNGTLSFILGQNTGSTYYNLAVACTTGTNSTGGPLANGVPWRYVNATGVEKSTYSASSAYMLQSGFMVVLNNTPCYGPTGALLGSQQLGTTFSGILWMKYTLGSGTAGTGGNPYIIAQIAQFATVVGKTGGSAR